VTRTRAEQFDDLVLDAVERVERRWSDELRDVELAVEEVPPGGRPDDRGVAVPLGQSAPAAEGRAARIVVYRRPVESRARDARLRAALVHDVVVERVAELLGLAPDAVDPDYGTDAPGGHQE
jgi:predicted Zn-dependent protease with MMP-like domain